MEAQKEKKGCLRRDALHKSLQRTLTITKRNGLSEPLRL